MCDRILLVELIATRTPAVMVFKGHETQVHTANCDHCIEPARVLWGFTYLFKCWEAMVVPHERCQGKHTNKDASQSLRIEPTACDETAIEYCTNRGFRNVVKSLSRGLLRIPDVEEDIIEYFLW